MNTGFITEQEAHKVYLKVKYDSICEVYDQPAEGLKKIEVNNPKTKEIVTKYIRPYAGVVAYVTGIEWYKREDKNTQKKYVGYNLHLDVGGQAAVLDLAYGKAAYRTFVRCAENVDWTQPVKFSAWKDKGKENATAFCLSQNETPIKWKFTRDNPNGMPPPVEQKSVGGESKWDWTAQEIWLKERIDEVVVPAIERANAARKPKDEFDGALEYAKRKEAKDAGSGTWSDGTPMPTQPEEEDSIPF